MPSSRDRMPSRTSSFPTSSRPPGPGPCGMSMTQSSAKKDMIRSRSCALNASRTSWSTGTATFALVMATFLSGEPSLSHRPMHRNPARAIRPSPTRRRMRCCGADDVPDPVRALRSMDNSDHGALRPRRARPSAQHRAAHCRGSSAARRSRRRPGRTEASTGCARCRTSGVARALPRPRARRRGRARAGSASSTTSATCAARSPRSTSDTRWSSTTSSRSGSRSTTTTGLPCTSSTVRVASGSSTSARRRTRRPSGRSQRLLGWTRSSSTSTREASPSRPTWVPRSPETYLGSAAASVARSGPRRQWTLEQEAAVLDGVRRARHPPLRGRATSTWCSRRRTRVSVPFSVRLDGEAPARRADSTSTSTARARCPSRGCTSSYAGEDPLRPGTFEIAVDGAGARAYVFTFG